MSETSSPKSPISSNSLPTDFSLMSSRHSALDMPYDGSKSAPKKFRGSPDKIKAFLRQFEKLANLHNLSDKEKCEFVTDYCSRHVKEVIEGFSSHRLGNWRTLKEDIERYFDADLDSKRFRVKDLESFVKDRRRESIHDLKAWRRYTRKFVRIAGWLLGKGKISETEFAIYMWQGISKSLRQKLELRLLQQSPNHDMSQPFGVDNIQKVAESLFQRDRFDSERLDEDSDDSEEDPLSDSSDDSETEDEIRERLRKIVRRKSSRKEGKSSISTKKVPSFLDNIKKASKPSRAVSPLETSSTKSKKDSEVESLIKQMSELTLDSPKYGLLYYQAIKLDPVVAQCVAKPILSNGNSQSPRLSNNSSNARTYPPAPPRQEMRTRPAISGCYGCGLEGHNMSDCPAINDLIDKKMISRNQRGMLVLSNGDRIMRSQNETFVQAIKRLNPVSNFITCQSYENYDSDCEVYAMTKPYSLPNTQNKDSGVRTRRMVKEASALEKNKPKENIRPWEQIQPLTTSQPRFNPNNDDAIMEDLSQPRPPRQNQNLRNRDENIRPVPRTSDISRQVDPAQIMNKIFDTTMTVKIGELLGSSKEVASQVQNALKFKKPDTPFEANTHYISPSHERLIRIEMNYRDHPLNFIVDTGSEINVISKDICDQVLKIPINYSKTTMMNDANGGRSKLLGEVKDIELHTGHIYTKTHFYVAENAPFDGLLGRPWQRAHGVGLVEKANGTYLTFPPMDGGKPSEVLVSPSPYSNEGPVVWTATIQEWEPDDKIPVDIADEDRFEEIFEEAIREPLPEDDDTINLDTMVEEFMTFQTAVNSSLEPNEPEENIEVQLEPPPEKNKDTEPLVDDLVDYFSDLILTKDDLDRTGEVEISANSGYTLPLKIDLDCQTHQFVLENVKMSFSGNTLSGHAYIQLFPHSRPQPQTNFMSLMAFYGHNKPATSRTQLTHREKLELMRQRRRAETRKTEFPLRSREHTPFIILDGKVLDHHFPFVVDSGSQINCLNFDVWKQLDSNMNYDIHKPSETEKYFRTSSSTLCKSEGLVKNVKIDIGNVVTFGTFHLIHNLPVVGILGLPWQSDAFCAIGRTPQGTLVSLASYNGFHTYQLLIKGANEGIDLTIPKNFARTLFLSNTGVGLSQEMQHELIYGTQDGFREYCQTSLVSESAISNISDIKLIAEPIKSPSLPSVNSSLISLLSNNSSNSSLGEIIRQPKPSVLSLTQIRNQIGQELSCTEVKNAIDHNTEYSPEENDLIVTSPVPGGILTCEHVIPLTNEVSGERIFQIRDYKAYLSLFHNARYREGEEVLQGTAIVIMLMTPESHKMIEDKLGIET